MADYLWAGKTYKSVIFDLCGIRPFAAEELAKILNRNKGWVRTSYLRPKLREGKIEYVNPDHPRQQGQAYRSIEKGKQWAAMNSAIPRAGLPTGYLLARRERSCTVKSWISCTYASISRLNTRKPVVAQVSQHCALPGHAAVRPSIIIPKSLIPKPA